MKRLLRAQAEGVLCSTLSPGFPQTSRFSDRDDMDVVFRFARHIVVLVDGKVFAEGAPSHRCQRECERRSILDEATWPNRH